MPADDGRGAPVTLEDFVGKAWGFEPALLFDVLPSGGIAFSDSSAYVIRLTDHSGMVSRIIAATDNAAARHGGSQTKGARAEVRNQKITSSGDASERTIEMAALTQALADTEVAAVENMQFFPDVSVIAALRATPRGHPLDPAELGAGCGRAGPHRRESRGTEAM